MRFSLATGVSTPTQNTIATSSSSTVPGTGVGKNNNQQTSKTVNSKEATIERERSKSNYTHSKDRSINRGIYDKPANKQSRGIEGVEEPVENPIIIFR